MYALRFIIILPILLDQRVYASNSDYENQVNDFNPSDFNISERMGEIQKNEANYGTEYQDRIGPSYLNNEISKKSSSDHRECRNESYLLDVTRGDVSDITNFDNPDDNRSTFPVDVKSAEGQRFCRVESGGCRKPPCLECTVEHAEVVCPLHSTWLDLVSEMPSPAQAHARG